MIHNYSDPMEEDVYGNDNVDASQAVESTQQSTQQATQQASQQTQGDLAMDRHVWGMLLPCRKGIERIDLWKNSPRVYVGRGSENDVILPSLKISNKHCMLVWDGKENDQSLVTVGDFSSNGTFLNGIKIGRNRSALLRDGIEIGFGCSGSQSADDDYRYIFRFMPTGQSNSGLYAFYDVGYELGKGSFATVVSAVSRETGQLYAVKMIGRSKFRGREGDGMNLFLREIAILEQLDHPNICNLKETFQDQNNIHIVLEYIAGGDLLDYIIKVGGLSEDATRYFTRQLVDSLKYIHSKGIAHRDLKPENILLTKDDPPILKVADFGLAKAVDSMTQFKTTCGTPCYLAPEVILRNPEQGYDQLVDSWSVGVIVFSMLTNASPFIDDGHESIHERFRSRYVDWDLLRDTGISPLGRDFIRRLLDDNPRTRMSCTDAVDHPWISSLNNPAQLTPRGLEPMYSFESNDAQDGSVISMIPANLSAVNGAGPSSQHSAIADGFEHIQMEDDQPSSQQPHIPGAFPASQGQSSRPLVRHPMEVSKRDEEGHLQSFEIIARDETPEIGPAIGGKKRKEFSGMDDDLSGSDSSELTPVSEDDANATDSATPAGSTGRNIRNLKKKAPAQPTATRGGRGKAPAKRTRASARKSGANGDVDM